MSTFKGKECLIIQLKFQFLGTPYEWEQASMPSSASDLVAVMDNLFLK